MIEKETEIIISFDEIETIYNRSMRKSADIISKLVDQCKILTKKCNALEAEIDALKNKTKEN